VRERERLRIIPLVPYDAWREFNVRSPSVADENHLNPSNTNASPASGVFFSSSALATVSVRLISDPPGLCIPSSVPAQSCRRRTRLTSVIHCPAVQATVGSRLHSKGIISSCILFVPATSRTRAAPSVILMGHPTSVAVPSAPIIVGYQRKGGVHRASGAKRYPCVVGWSVGGKQGEDGGPHL
jgi:hypothetical protein